jgi:hypothetical protein
MDEEVRGGYVTSVIAADINARPEEEVGAKLADDEGESSEHRDEADDGRRPRSLARRLGHDACSAMKRPKVMRGDENPVLVDERSKRQVGALRREVARARSVKLRRVVTADGAARELRGLGVSGPRDTLHNCKIYLAPKG